MGQRRYSAKTREAPDLYKKLLILLYNIKRDYNLYTVSLSINWPSHIPAVLVWGGAYKREKRGGPKGGGLLNGFSFKLKL